LLVLEVPERLRPEAANTAEHKLREEGEPDDRCAGNEIWSLPHDVCDGNDVLCGSFSLPRELFGAELEFSGALFKDPL
jgi:hypothetical protein